MALVILWGVFKDRAWGCACARYLLAAACAHFVFLGFTSSHYEMFGVTAAVVFGLMTIVAFKFMGGVVRRPN